MAIVDIYLPDKYIDEHCIEKVEGEEAGARRKIEKILLVNTKKADELIESFDEESY